MASFNIEVPKHAHLVEIQRWLREMGDCAAIEETTCIEADGVSRPLFRLQLRAFSEGRSLEAWFIDCSESATTASAVDPVEGTSNV